MFSYMQSSAAAGAGGLYVGFCFSAASVDFILNLCRFFRLPLSGIGVISAACAEAQTGGCNLNY